MMRVYALSPLGQAVARSLRFPDSNDWKIIHHLKRVNHATPDQMATYCGISQGEVAAALGRLHRKKLVIEETGVEV